MAGIEMIYPELIINTKNWQHLNHAWKSDRLPHALLFHGIQGTGKEGHALELAVRGELIGDFPLNNKSFNLSYVGFDL